MRNVSLSFVRLFPAVLAILAGAAGHGVFALEEHNAAGAGLPTIGPPLRESDADKFSFAILGDKTSGGEGKWPVFDRAVDAINLLRPDFVITVGDQIPGHMQERAQWDAEWGEYLDHARRLEAPLLLTAGNHDIANVECYAFWKQDFGRTYYSFDYAGCHFLILNTEEERVDGRGPVWQEMMAFAEKDLTEHTKAPHTFVFFHKPMWTDPRYEEDWARLANALGQRRFTVIAGHEHYLSAERRDGNLLVIQNATGAGLSGVSDDATITGAAGVAPGVREFGCFHAFGYVTVEGENVTYAVAEPNGGVWPVDVAPASFRKAVTFDMLTLDAEPTLAPAPSNPARVHAFARFHNTLPEAVTVEAAVPNWKVCGWEPVTETTEGWQLADGALSCALSLEPGGSVVKPLAFRVSPEHLDTPPRVTYRVEYKGDWLQNEAFPMVQEDIAPIGPVARLRAVPEWQLVGPFSLGDIDADLLPAHPEQANPNFFKRFGPEDGYRPEAAYEGGLRWFSAKAQGRGLLNFNALMGTRDHALGYALCGVHTPEAQTVYALVYSDNYHQAVLNGDLVEEGQDFGAPSGFTYVPLALRSGWNTLLIKLINNHGDWFLRVLVSDPEDNLQFAPFPPDAARNAEP